MLYQFIQNDTSDKKIDYQVQSAQAKDSSDSKNNIDTAIDTNADFSVLVESPIYNAVVSLDEGSKEFKVKSDFSLEPFSGAYLHKLFLHCSIFKVHPLSSFEPLGSLATACLRYHIQTRLSRTFFKFFQILFAW